ncbi:MAG: phosphonate ABC transporter ATP-binding protein [Candidatus Kapabacteria bacterium]|jgi:phosphonate transport system ATP-binding protein|nr:phosphonate ABC transporter ATP-binding protein [Candidatus Kapabacteria bacterium]
MLFDVTHLEKVYPNGTYALKGVSLSVEEGEFLVVIGLSGSGKSTLLRCLSRLHEPTSGIINFENRDITHIKGNDLRAYRQQIGMVFQHFNLIKRRSVLDNVIAGRLGSLPVLQSIFGKFPSHVRDEAMEKLSIVGLADKSHVRADALSGGQQQRVAIARTLMQRPKVLLADEPVASLDPATSHSVMQYLEYINKEYGTTVICNLHFLSLVRQYASRVVALKGGELMFEGGPGEIDRAWFARIYGDEAVEVEIE